nr:MAG TPA: hypothetical protein [Caudoviricetes sp.]
MDEMAALSLSPKLLLSALVMPWMQQQWKQFFLTSEYLNWIHEEGR